MTLPELIGWIQSLRGTTIRGKKVDYASLTIFDNGEATITADLAHGSGNSSEKLFQHLRNELRLIADVPDITTMEPSTLNWLYLDELNEGIS